MSALKEKAAHMCKGVRPRLVNEANTLCVLLVLGYLSG